MIVFPGSEGIWQILPNNGSGYLLYPPSCLSLYPPQPIKTIVNTSEDTIFARNINSNFGSDRQGLITVNLERSGPNVSWGFRLQGGKDRGLAFQILKVSGYTGMG